MALLGDLTAANRRLTEQVLIHVRELEASLGARDDLNQSAPRIAGLRRSAAPPWTAPPSGGPA
jgi:hypothetical protein